LKKSKKNILKENFCQNTSGAEKYFPQFFFTDFSMESKKFVSDEVKSEYKMTFSSGTTMSRVVNNLIKIIDEKTGSLEAFLNHIFHNLRGDVGKRMKTYY
jgi:hypothetical protein